MASPSRTRSPHFAPFLISALALAPSTSAGSATGAETRVHGTHRTEFHADSVTLSAGARERARALTLRWHAYGRGTERTAAPPVARRTLTQDGASYERGPVTERYELRPEGLEQSFVFDELPGGSGDLVVSVEVSSELALRRARAGELLFGDDARGHLRIGAVLGIDAAGRRSKGALAWRDGRVEMSLPASFVDLAALPLVLDPLVGELRVASTLTSFQSTLDPVHDVAYLAAADLYHVAWVREFSAVESFAEVRGQLLSSSGTPVGPDHMVSTNFSGQNSGYFARVAAVEGARSFLVAVFNSFLGQFNLSTAVVDELGNVAQGPSIFSGVSDLDVGGEASPAFDDAVVAYVGSGSLNLSLIDVPTRTRTRAINLVSGALTMREVAISATGGLPGRYLVVWSQRGAVGTSIWGAVVSRSLTVLAPPFPIADGATDDSAPEVDGDGRSWVVAFQRTTAGVGDVHCRGVSFDPSSGSVSLGPERVVASDPVLDQRDPAVAWTGESYLVAWSEQWEGADYDVYVRSVESLDCLDCEGRQTVAYFPSADRPVRLAAQRAAGGTGDEALIGFVRNDGTLVQPGLVANDLLVQRYRAQDGTVLDLGGGCGPAGEARATCGLSGTPNFGVGLRGAAPLSPATLALGVKSLGFGCGACTFVPDPLFLLRTTTDSQGDAGRRLPLPPAVVLPGLKILAQWIVRTPGPCGTFGAASLSNALEISVQ